MQYFLIARINMIFFFVDILHALNIFLIILFPEIIDKKKRYLYDLMLFISFISERKRAIHIFV